MKASASAPGKIILFGEHFVVKGAPSIVTAICRRVHVHISEEPHGRFIVESDRLRLRISTRPGEAESLEGPLAPLAGILRWFRDRKDVRPAPVRVVVRSEIPVGAGLGSSAAFAAAFALAYARLHGLKLSLAELEEASLAAERIAHGRPSGIDTAIAVRGGTLLYSKGSPPERLHLRLPEGYTLLVADSGVLRSTRQVVEHVIYRASRTGGSGEALYGAARILVRDALEAFERGDAERLGLLMDLNQGLLYALGASSFDLERLVFAARRAGALGAKLTGAGWGGSVIALVPVEREQAVRGALLGAGAREVFETSLGCEGARPEG